MNCKYFGKCGACVVYDLPYDIQLNNKVQKIKDSFREFYTKDISVFGSQDIHYRSRSEFKIWHSDDDIRYAMNSINKEGVVFIDECPQVDTAIFELMPKLLLEIKNFDIAHKLFGVDFLSSNNGGVVVSLLYHKKLDSKWQESAKEIANRLKISIIGRSRGQKVVIGDDFVIEELCVDEEVLKYKYIENSFTQPNRYVNEQMISWAKNRFSGIGGDLLELYCGAGNFTIAFAKVFNKVLATEISKSSINAAKENMSFNGVDNIEFVRMSVEEFRDALDGVREFNRMKHIDISSYHIDAIFVDPPRSGMDEESCKFASRYKHILYISCNPDTLKRDLEILTKTHTVEDMAIFDQFAYTNHLEMGVKLTKK